MAFVGAGIRPNMNLQAGNRYGAAQQGNTSNNTATGIGNTIDYMYAI